MNTRHLVACVATLGFTLVAAPFANADTTCSVEDAQPHLSMTFASDAVADDAAPRVWHDLFADTAPPAAADAPSLAAQADEATTAAAQDAPTRRPRAVQFSKGYEVRQKIHRLASWATMPLFVTEYILGEKLYDGTGSESVKGAHGAVAGGVAALFGVNTITGVWNLVEARKKPEGRTRRIIHSVLMLGADAGFVATGMLAPDIEDGGDYTDNRSRHRTVAIASMGVATASYLFMLLTR